MRNVAGKPGKRKSRPVYDQAAVEIATGAVLAGHLPSRAWRLVQEWFDLHRAEVEENWRLIQGGRRFFRIEPL